MSVAGLSAATAVRPLVSAMLASCSAAYVPAVLWVGAEGRTAAIAFSCAGPPGAAVDAWGPICAGGAGRVAGVQVGVGAVASTLSLYPVNAADGTPNMAAVPLLTTTVPLVPSSTVFWLAANPFYTGPGQVNVSLGITTLTVNFDKTIPQFAPAAVGGGYLGSVLATSMAGSPCASACSDPARALADAFATLALSNPSLAAQVPRLSRACAAARYLIVCVCVCVRVNACAVRRRPRRTCCRPRRRPRRRPRVP